jgi:hypothetical protein
MIRQSSVALLFVAACVPDPGGTRTVTKSPDLAPDARAATIEAGGELARNDKDAAPPQREPIPEGPRKWRTVPTAQNGFYAVLDGLCSELGATRVGDGVVVQYGGGSNPMYLDGKRRGPASFIALRDDGLESIGDPVISSPTGVAGRSVDDFWIADSTGSRSSEGAILHRWANHQWKTFAKDQTNLQAWVDGGVIGTLGMAAANGDVWVEGSTTKPPASLWSDMMFPRLAAFPTGDVLVSGSKGSGGGTPGPLVARHWAPGQKVTEYPLAALFPGEKTFGPVFEGVSPDEIYAVDDDRIARWDGKGLKLLGVVKGAKDIFAVRRAGPDDLWVQIDDQRLFHVTAAGVVPIATPEKVASFDGVEVGKPWMVGASGKLYAREGETWKPQPLPVPVFSAGGVLKAKQVVVVAPDDVLVVGKYWEKGPGWTEQELHTALFRNKPVKETLRCNEPDPENNNVHLGHGFQSWPPMATAACKTPFVVIARRSNARKVADDWPKLRRALKGHTELGEVSLVELVSGDRTFVGAKAKDLDAAKALLAIVAKADRLRPEIVCGEPEAKRTIAVDLATGAATEK